MSAVRVSDGRVLLSMRELDAIKLGWLLTLVDYVAEEGLAELGDCLDAVGLGPDDNDDVDVALDKTEVLRMIDKANEDMSIEEVQQ